MERLPNSFADSAKVTRSHILAANTPSRIQLTKQPAHVAPARAKRGRPTQTGEAPNKQRRSVHQTQATTYMVDTMPSDTQDENDEISLNYKNTGNIIDRNNTLPDERFAFLIAQQLESEDQDPAIVQEAQASPD